MGSTSGAPTEAALRRALSWPLVTFYGLGGILGAGIYALVGKVAGAAGLYAPTSFLLAAVLASFSAASMAELAARYPKSAGEALYVQAAFGRPWLSLVVGLGVVASGVVSAATIVRAFVGYLEVFVAWPDALVVVGVVSILGAFCVWGISESTWLVLVTTLVEVAGLLLVVWVARDSLAEAPARAGELFPPLEAPPWEGVFLGGFLAFFAFIGFEDIVNVAEETRAPARDLPIGIGLALLGATVLYLLVAAASVLAVEPSDLAASDAPLALVYERATGGEPTAIAVISLFAVVNGALVQLVMGSRVLYGLARQGWLPRALGRVNAVTRTPLAASAAVIGVVLALALAFPLVALAEATTSLILVVFALVNAALWRIKAREPTAPGAWSAPRWVPLVGAVVSLAVLALRSATALV